MVQDNYRKIKLLKLLELLRAESDEQNPITTSALCGRLEAMGIVCDRRTLSKDIALLNEHGYEIMSTTVGHEKGYYIDDRGFSVPELKILIDAVQASAFITEKKTRELVEKLAELVNAGLSFDEIRHTITAYTKKTGLLFMLESLKNFANNGRVSPAVAKIAGLLGIRIVGKASDEGTLEPLDKCRGEGKALCAILTRLEQSGVREGRILIHHSSNPAAADALAALVREKFPLARVQIGTCRGLCSYYAEKGGLLVGFEKF
jgi:hypothetical protein